MSRFQKATRKQLKLRLALVGPTGSGKTYTALCVAGYLGRRIAVIDTENRSASKYVGAPGIPEFDVLELDSYSPKTYVDAIREAEREGYDVIVVDSATHAWSGKDGALEMVDRAAKRSQSGNSFTAWRDVTPHHNALVEALVQCKAHLITTLRSKMEYVLEEDARGKKTPRKVGMAPIQRDGMEYEFDVVGDLDVEHHLLVSKTRCNALDGAVIHKPGKEFAEKLLAWLDEGIREAPKPAPLAASSATQSQATSNGEIRQEATPGQVPGSVGSDDAIAGLLIDLPGCGTREALVAWARELTAVKASGSAKKPAWDAWAAQCSERQLQPSELAAEARGKAA